MNAKKLKYSQKQKLHYHINVLKLILRIFFITEEYGNFKWVMHFWARLYIVLIIYSVTVLEKLTFFWNLIWEIVYLS